MSAGAILLWEACEAERVERFLRERLPAYALCHLDPALSDGATEDHGDSLILAAPNRFRGAVVLLLYYRRAIETLRGALAGCWSHDHDILIETVQHRTRLRSIFD